MNPGSEWVVQFAIREKLAREQRARALAGQEEWPGPAIAAPGFGQQSLRRVGHLLLVLGAWLNRMAGEAPGADRAAEAWGERRIDRGTPSWT